MNSLENFREVVECIHDKKRDDDYLIKLLKKSHKNVIKEKLSYAHNYGDVSNSSLNHYKSFHVLNTSLVWIICVRTQNLLFGMKLL